VKEPFGFGEFGGEDQNIESEVSATTAGMKVTHDEGEVRFSEIFGSETGVEGGKAKVDGIGPCGNGGFEAIPVARWS
jgi:hypothetical protein